MFLVKLPESKLEKFIAKRTLIVYMVIALLDIVLVRQRWITLLGLTAGGVLGLLRLGALAYFVEHLVIRTNTGTTAGHRIFAYIVVQLASMLMLVISIMYSTWLFAGVTAGILLVTFVILLNCLTEGLGITHNRFE